MGVALRHIVAKCESGLPEGFYFESWTLTPDKPNRRHPVVVSSRKVQVIDIQIPFNQTFPLHNLNFERRVRVR